MCDTQDSDINWSFFKIFVAVLLFSLGGAGIYMTLTPLLEGDYSLKSFANLLFTATVMFYMLSFMRVRKVYHFLFWSASFSIAILTTVLFLNYESLFE